jgi:hypothetical protein
MLQKKIARKNDELYQLRKLLTQKDKQLVHVEGSTRRQLKSLHATEKDVLSTEKKKMGISVVVTSLFLMVGCLSPCARRRIRVPSEERSRTRSFGPQPPCWWTCKNFSLMGATANLRGSVGLMRRRYTYLT